MEGPFLITYIPQLLKLIGQTASGASSHLLKQSLIIDSSKDKNLRRSFEKVLLQEESLQDLLDWNDNNCNNQHVSCHEWICMDSNVYNLTFKSQRVGSSESDSM